MSRQANTQENAKVRRKETSKYGLGVFATANINKGELISSFDGALYQAPDAMSLPNEPPLYAGRHAIEYAEGRWRDGQVDRIARYVAHSCEPNCGIKNLFNIVAMRDIEAGEEVTWDYAMSEDSNFRMDCLCGKSTCRGTVGAFSLLSPKQRIDFINRCANFISLWLVYKYELY